MGSVFADRADDRRPRSHRFDRHRTAVERQVGEQCGNRGVFGTPMAVGSSISFFHEGS